jgi:hypothetical protein
VITATLFSSFFMMRVFEVRMNGPYFASRADRLPGIQADSSDARKTIAGAVSASCPNRPIRSLILN